MLVGQSLLRSKNSQQVNQYWITCCCTALYVFTISWFYVHCFFFYKKIYIKKEMIWLSQFSAKYFSPMMKTIFSLWKPWKAKTTYVEICLETSRKLAKQLLVMMKVSHKLLVEDKQTSQQLDEDQVLTCDLYLDLLSGSKRFCKWTCTQNAMQTECIGISKTTSGGISERP